MASFRNENTDLRIFLEEKAALYNKPEFIDRDPVLIPHNFSRKENIEISAFLTSSIAWGNRTSILKNAWHLMSMMDNDPFQFITGSSDRERKQVSRFVHRTINGEDMLFFVEALRNIYLHHGGLEEVFGLPWKQNGSLQSALIHFHQLFFSIPYPERSRRHIADVERNSAAKRLNLFLRWMVRPDNQGVDFGLWKGIPPSALMLPLDVHTGRVARKLGLLKRNQNDWKAVEEVTSVLREFDPADPVKYDYALFGLGLFEGFA
jgi:uncharacterized protein (TIGR02757 family)